MDTKAAFEKWFDENYGTDYGNDDLGISLKIMAWQGWQASRAAIEIELPSPICDDLMLTEEVVEAITYHGIRIKGKTE